MHAVDNVAMWAENRNDAATPPGCRQPSESGRQILPPSDNEFLLSHSVCGSFYSSHRKLIRQVTAQDAKCLLSAFKNVVAQYGGKLLSKTN